MPEMASKLEYSIVRGANESAFSPAAVGNSDEETFFTTTASPSLLIADTNVLVVEILQANATGSDLGFALELSADPAPPRLNWALAGSSTVLTCPIWATGFRLQAAAQLAPVTSWSNLVAPSRRRTTRTE